MKVLLGLVIILLITNNTFAQPSQQNNAPLPPEPPQVQIETQSDAPLRISSVKTQWVSDRRGIELYITVENISGKDISAYATFDDSGGEGARSCLPLSARSPGKALRPGRSEGRSTWRGYNSSAPSPLRRVVDFVEFTDGTTWGADVCQSTEWLGGMRAGAREARRLLREIFAVGGADGVLETLKAQVPPAEPPQDRSQVWQQAFYAGFGGYVDRIRQANQEWGFTEIEYALSRPIDALPEEAALAQERKNNGMLQKSSAACLSSSKGCGRR